MRASTPASLARERAAWPLMAVPSTRWPSASKAARTTSRAVVLPDPATPTTTSRPRPEPQMAPTARRWPSVSCRPRRSSAAMTDWATIAGATTGRFPDPARRSATSSTAASAATTEAAT